MEEMQTCTMCGKTLPLSEFHVDRSRKSGVQCYCKKCKSERAKNRIAGRRATIEEIRKMAQADGKTKMCTVCGRWLPLAYFHKQSTGKYGYHSKCRECYNKIKREEYAQRRAEYLANKEDATQTVQPYPVSHHNPVDNRKRKQ